LLVPALQQIAAIEVQRILERARRFLSERFAWYALGEAEGALEGGNIKPEVSARIELYPLWFDPQHRTRAWLQWPFQNCLEVPQGLSERLLRLRGGEIAPEHAAEGFARMVLIATQQQIAQQLLDLARVEAIER